MKRPTAFSALSACLALILLVNAAAIAADNTATNSAASANATITGQVSNAATKSFLEGAVVELSDANRSTVTDREGRYRFDDVPSGVTTLAVSFPGLDPQRIPVPLSGGQNIVHDVKLTSEIYRLEKFTVAGDREGMAKAQVLQRQAPNVKDVVSSDAFGNVADGNIGYLLQHIVGVTPVLDGMDVRAVSVRGLTSELTTVTMDGQQVGQSPQAGASRRFDFNQQSLANIEAIEVTKAPTPDMDASAIGGSVNLVTKSAFDRAGGRSFDYSIGAATEIGMHFPAARWKEPIAGYSPSLSFNYRDVIGAQRNIGIAVNGTYFNIQNSGVSYREVLQNTVVPGPAYTYLAARTLSNKNRLLLALGMKLEYRWSERTSISVGLTNNYSDKLDNNPAFTLTTAQTLAIVDANGNRTGGGTINPNFADGITRIFAQPQSNVTLTAPRAATTGTTRGVQPTLRSRFDGWDITAALNYSVSNTSVDSSRNGTMTVSLANVGWNVDRTQDPKIPVIRQTQGANIYDLNSYTGVLTQRIQDGSDTVRSAKLDVRRDLALTVPTYLKTGLSYNVQQRRLSLPSDLTYNFTGPDGILGNADDSRDLAQFKDTSGLPFSDGDFLKAFRDPGGVVPFPDVNAVAQNQRLHPELWVENVALGFQRTLLGYRKGTEEIAAAYFMGNARLGRLSVLSGVRFDDTRRSGEGPLTYLSPAERARQAAWVGPVTTTEAVRRAQAQYGNRQTNRGKYRNFFPGVHLKFQPFPGMVTRASWATSIGRPSFGSIIPLETVNDANQTVTASNPQLKPQYANSYDLSAAYYFKMQGMISVGVFRKNITDFIFTDTSGFVGTGADNGFDGNYAGYKLSTQSNRGTARIDGFEANYAQPLNFLPGWTKGFSVNANYTALKTTGDYGAGVKIATNALAGFINHAANVGLGYRGYGFDLKLQMIYTGNYLYVTSTSPALLQYINPRTIWSWKSTYNLSRTSGFFLDVDNLFSTMRTDIYQLYPDRSSIYGDFPVKVIGGIRGRF